MKAKNKPNVLYAISNKCFDSTFKSILKQIECLSRINTVSCDLQGYYKVFCCQYFSLS